MTNPKRYDPVIYGDETGVDDGRYVRWEDYERLQAIIANCRTYVAEAADRYPRGQPSVLLAAIDKATNTSEPSEQQLCSARHNDPNCPICHP